MKKIQEFDPNFITREFFSRYPVDEINMGLCFKWAELASLMFLGVRRCSTDYHAFVKYRGKYYDSEAPQGKDHWLDLKFFVRSGQIGCDCKNIYNCPKGIHQGLHMEVQSKKTFREEWNSQPRRFKFTWDDLDVLAKEGIRTYLEEVEEYDD